MPRKRKKVNYNIDKKIIICGVVKNNGKKMKFNIKKCLETGNYFKDFRVIIYENNSKDRTKNILSKYKDHDKVIIMSEDLENIKRK